MKAFETVEDGDYKVSIESATIGNSKKGNLMVTYKLKVLEGKSVGKIIFKYDLLTSMKMIAWAKRSLMAIGIYSQKEGAEFRDLMPELLKGIVGKIAMINKKTNNGYENIRFISVVE